MNKAKSILLEKNSQVFFAENLWKESLRGKILGLLKKKQSATRETVYLKYLGCGSRLLWNNAAKDFLDSRVELICIHPVEMSHLETIV